MAAEKKAYHAPASFNNKKARFEYTILESYEAGIALTGAEVKSVKLGNINLRDSFCFITNGEIFLKNCHITPYEKGSAFNPEPLRDRKLLLHKSEIAKISGKIKQKGLTLVPLKVYFKANRLKVEIALCEGKKLYDKRQTIKERDLKKKAERDIASARGRE